MEWAPVIEDERLYDDIGDDYNPEGYYTIHRIRDAANRYLSAHQRRVIDIGCGVGILALYLRQRGFRAPIVGIDHDARKIDIAEATVKVHVKAILRKIRVQNRTQAAIWGMSNDSVTRPTNSDSPFLTFDVRQPLPNPVPVISEINQIGASVPLTAIGHDAKPKLLNGSRLRRRRTD